MNGEKRFEKGEGWNMARYLADMLSMHMQTITKPTGIPPEIRALHRACDLETCVEEAARVAL